MNFKTTLLLVAATATLSAVGNVLPKTNDTVSFKSFMKHVAIPVNGGETSLYDWDMPGNEDAFTWYPERNVWKGKGFVRGGKVYFNNDGRITHRTVGNTIEDGYWEIELVGNKRGITWLSLTPNEISEENPRFEIDSLFIKEKMLCLKTANRKVMLYKIKYPKRKAYWVNIASVTSKDGSGAVYQLHFKDRPSCALEDQSAGEKQVYVDRCINLAGPKHSYKAIYADEAIGTCEIAVEVSSENAKAAFSLGRAYKKAGNIKKSLIWYRKAANLHSGDAQYALGKMFIKGESVKKSRLLGKSLFESAIENGSVNAMVWLGVIHIQGINGAKNYTEAERLFRKAISFGSKGAKKNLKLLNDLKKKEKESEKLIKENISSNGDTSEETSRSETVEYQ